MPGPRGRDAGGAGGGWSGGWPLSDPTPPPRPARPEPRGQTPSLFDGVPGGSPTTAVAVSAVTQIAKQILEGAVRPLWVRGEVTDFKAHRSGHWYFCLRDQV